jgi:microcystin-dependent protein
MSANCDEQVVRIRQRVVFSAIVGSDVPSAGVEAFRLPLRATRPLWTSTPGASLGETE